MSSTTLHICRAGSSLSLSDALRKCGGSLRMAQGDPIALLMSPSRCVFGRLAADGLIYGPDPSRPINLADVYEARVFSPRAELRWLNGIGEANRTVLLSPEAFPDPPPLDGEGEIIGDVETIPQTYLIWGAGTGRSAFGSGWSTLETARIGRLEVPIEGVPPAGRVLLEADEYVRSEPEHGNAYVFEERLVGLGGGGTWKKDN